MMNKYVKTHNIILFILEILFLNYILYQNNFYNSYTIGFLIFFSLYKKYKIYKMKVKKAYLATFLSIAICSAFINFIPILKSLVEIARYSINEPNTSIEYFMLYFQFLSIFVSILGFFFIAVFGFFLNSRINSFYFLYLFIVLCMFSSLVYISILNQYFTFLPIFFIMFYFKIYRYVVYFISIYLRRRTF